MEKLTVFGVMLFGIHPIYAATHSLKYFYTAVSGKINFPEFTIMGLVDDGQFMFYDSELKKVIPKTEWMERSMDAQYWNQQTQIASGTQQEFKANVQVLMKRFNHTEGVHTLQFMYGCEWNDETGVIDALRQSRYDGEDFIALDFKTWTYTAAVPQAVITKHKWENAADIEYRKSYYTMDCFEWLKKYVEYGRTNLQRKVPPEVSLLQKSPSSPVTCHATGFFPKGIFVSWQKNGEDWQEDVELGETVPNEDGTFQITSYLRVSPEQGKKDTFACVVQHNSLERDIVMTVREEEIKRNIPGNRGPPVGTIIGLLLVAVFGVVVFKRIKTASNGSSGDLCQNSKSLRSPSKNREDLKEDNN